jgi:hypothetical protein
MRLLDRLTRRKHPGLDSEPRDEGEPTARDERRDASIRDTDENATGEASAAQSSSDAASARAGSPADQGGQG